MFNYYKQQLSVVSSIKATSTTVASGYNFIHSTDVLSCDYVLKVFQFLGQYNIEIRAIILLNIHYITNKI